jgi:heme-degrading monooxygenase HmoA
MSASGLADDLPEPPYHVVIFSSLRTGGGSAAYTSAAERMLALARAQPGFLGVESARDPSGLGITVSYWRDAASIARWREHAEHLEVQARGGIDWYAAFELRVARVERAHGMRRPADALETAAESAARSAP